MTANSASDWLSSSGAASHVLTLPRVRRSSLVGRGLPPPDAGHLLAPGAKSNAEYQLAVTRWRWSPLIASAVSGLGACSSSRLDLSAITSPRTLSVTSPARQTFSHTRERCFETSVPPSPLNGLSLGLRVVHGLG